MDGFDLSAALSDCDDNSSQSTSSQTNPNWPGGGNSSGSRGMWPRPSAGSEGIWPSRPSPSKVPGGMWPSEPCPSKAPGRMWPSGPSANQGPGGMWPSGPSEPCPSKGPGGMWPSGPSEPCPSKGPGGMWPPGPSPNRGPGGMWPPGQSPYQGPGGMWPSGPSPNQEPEGMWPSRPSTGHGDVWPGASPGGSANPSCAPGVQPSILVAPQQSLKVPYEQSFCNGFCNKLMITINGTIKPSANMITVDMYKEDDVAFHFNPRFNEGGKQVIVRNSRIGKKWGCEERCWDQELKCFPFTQGQPFMIKILCTDDEFKVAVDNKHLLQYKHRVDYRKITKLKIHKDLTLSGVKCEILP
ncbi:galectin-3b [Pholidichthys leucotaenia]